MSNEVENLIIASLVHNKDYRNTVYPHVKEKYFESDVNKNFFKLFADYHTTYVAFPSKEALLVEASSLRGISEQTATDLHVLVDKIFDASLKEAICSQDSKWLLDKTEKYLKTRACFLGVMECISVIDGENKKTTIEAFPDIMKEALAISFDNRIGHDYIDDAESRFDFYHKVENRIPFSLTRLNQITNGGAPRKALIVPLAPTGVGKTLFLCNEAAHWLQEGFNVLYISLEMAEERLAERIDANLMDISLNDLRDIPRDSFLSKIEKMKTSTLGKLIFREYPAGTFNANHLRFLLQDIQAKKGYKPDIVIVDYLSLMASYRMKSPDNTYTYVKAVTEELRGVMMEFDLLGVSPTQTNREGQNSTDFELNQMSESHGVSMTADMIFGLISTPEMEKIGRLRIKQLKNRFGDLNYFNSFVVGITRGKMRLYDIDDDPQQSVTPQLLVESKASGLVF